MVQHEERPLSTTPAVVTREAWLRARQQLLLREKELSRQRDAVSEARRQLPMVRIDTPYTFEDAAGRCSLLDLFDGRRQLLLYHFMFEPGQQQGCPSCSFVADNLSGALVHLGARDTAFAAVSLAPRADIEPFQRRMGWDFRWVSSFGTDFNRDFHVTIDETQPQYNYRPRYFHESPESQKGPARGEAPGLSVFLRDGDQVFHTWSTYTRGLDALMTTYTLLDFTPLGRHEEMGPTGPTWLRHHDAY